MTIKYNLPTNATELNKLISAALTAVKSGRNRLQVACVAILHHAYKHGDYSAAGNMVLELADSGVRRDAVVEWFKIYGGLLVNDDPETQKDKPFSGWKGVDHIEAHFSDAKENMWWLAKAEKDPFVEGDLGAELAKLLGKYGKMIKKAEKAGSEFRGKIVTKVSQETLDQLMALSSLPPIIESRETDIMAALEGMITGPDTHEDDADQELELEELAAAL